MTRAPLWYERGAIDGLAGRKPAFQPPDDEAPAAKLYYLGWHAGADRRTAEQRRGEHGDS